MKITETEMRGLITGKAMPADIFVGESIAAYLVRKFSNLHTDRDALAAENARMRIAIDHTIGWQESVDTENTESVRPLHELETPATDAYLNSVRAEGVESFAHQQRVIADATPAAAFQRDRRFAAGLAEDFASQLRAGKDGE